MSGSGRWRAIIISLVIVILLASCFRSAVPSATDNKPPYAPTAQANRTTPTTSSGSLAAKSTDSLNRPPIPVGVVSSLTGDQAGFGAIQEQGYDMAAAEINEAGGVNGRPLQLLYEDDGGNPERTVVVVEKLITQDKVVAVVGSYASDTTATAAPIATKYQTPLVIPSGSEDAILEQGSRWLFRISAPSSGFAKSAVEFLANVPKVRSLAVVYLNGAYGKSLSMATKRAADEKSINVLALETYKSQDSDLRAVLQRVKAVDPESILFASYLADATLLLKQAKEIDLDPKVFIGGGAGFSDNAFLKPQYAGKNAEYTFASSQWTPQVKWAGAKELAAKYEREYGAVPQYHFVQAYASLYVLADALNRADSLERGKIRDALAATDMLTVFGPVRFDASGQNDHSLVVTQVQNGKFVTVYPDDVKEAEPLLPTPPWNRRN